MFGPPKGASLRHTNFCSPGFRSGAFHKGCFHGFHDFVVLAFLLFVPPRDTLFGAARWEYRRVSSGEDSPLGEDTGCCGCDTPRVWLTVVGLLLGERPPIVGRVHLCNTRGHRAFRPLVGHNGGVTPHLFSRLALCVTCRGQ